MKSRLIFNDYFFRKTHSFAFFLIYRVHSVVLRENNAAFAARRPDAVVSRRKIDERRVNQSAR